MSWKDKLMMKLLTNKLLIKFMSIPIVVKVLTKMTQAFIWVASLFSKKKTQPDEGKPS